MDALCTFSAVRSWNPSMGNRATEGKRTRGMFHPHSVSSGLERRSLTTRAARDGPASDSCAGNSNVPSESSSRFRLYCAWHVLGFYQVTQPLVPLTHLS